METNRTGLDVLRGGRFDLFLTQTLAHPPIRHGQGSSVLDALNRKGLLRLAARLGALDSAVNQMARDALQHLAFTQLANLTGTPATSAPLHWTADDLPLGAQFVGRFGDGGRLLQLARQLKQAMPWFDRRPAWVRDAV